MNQELFDFLTFELADYENYPALRLQKLISASNRYNNYQGVSPISTPLSPVQKGIDAEIAIMKEKYTEEELTATEQMWTDFYVEQIGNELGVELLTSAKASKETMMKAVALGDEGFERVVARSVKVGNELNRRTQEIELKNKASGNHTL